MKPYHKEDLAQDVDGYFRNLGRDSKGQRIRFRFGRDHKRAIIASAKVLTLHERLGYLPWCDLSLEIAKAIARSQPSIILEGGQVEIIMLQRLCEGLIQVMPVDEYKHRL